MRHPLKQLFRLRSCVVTSVSPAADTATSFSPSRLLQQLFGPLGLHERRCAHCLRPFDPAAEQEDSPFCPDCAPLFSVSLSGGCPRCGLPVSLHEDATASVPCGQCLASPPPWQHFACCGLYEGALRDLVLRLKFGGELPLAGVLAHLLLEHLRQQAPGLPAPDLVLAMPQHPAHLRQRGYNQAHELAAALCRKTGLPLAAGLLYRTRETSSQAGLSASRRRRNVHGSFAATPPPLQGRRCWLVDDVMTTGSTAREACVTLLDAGAAAVDVLVVARTPRLDAMTEGRENRQQPR